MEPDKICLIVDCTISRSLIDYFYKNRLIGSKEIIDYEKINRASLMSASTSNINEGK